MPCASGAAHTVRDLHRTLLTSSSPRCSVRDFRQFPCWMVAVVCLGFTGSGVAWAESRRPAGYVEDPMAPHDTSGTTARVGTAVGFIYGEQLDVLALGMTAAAGQRWGRLTVEAEYSYLGFQVKGPSGLRLG